MGTQLFCLSSEGGGREGACVGGLGYFFLILLLMLVPALRSYSRDSKCSVKRHKKD